MRFDYVGISLRLTLPRETALAPVSMSAAMLGERLAETVDAYVMQSSLGYYPPLDYFEDRDGFDQALISAARKMAWQNSKLVRERVEKNLKPIFSAVKFRSIQTAAFNMPRVRVHAQDAVVHLGRHYSPDVIRVDLIVSMVRRDGDRRSDAAEVYARKMMFRWLSEAFENVEIASSCIEQGA